MKKIIILMSLILISIAFTLKINAKLSPNIEMPQNQIGDTWSSPIETYQGSWMVSQTITLTTDSTYLSYYIPSQDVRSITITATSSNANMAIYNMTDGITYVDLLANTMLTRVNITVLELPFVPVSVKFEVYTDYNFVAGGGNTGTWRTNIVTWSYLSTSRFWSASGIGQIFYDSGYDYGWNVGEKEGFDSGWWEGFGDGQEAGQEPLDLNAIPRSIGSGLQSILNLNFAGMTIGGLIMIPLMFSIFIWFIRFTKGGGK